MTTLLHSLPVLLLITAITAADAQAGSTPALLPAGLAPAGLRLQATFAAARPDQGMAVFGQNGQTSLRRAGSDLGNGLQLLRILTDRVVLSHGSREYYLPLRPAASDERRPSAMPVKRQATATGHDLRPASHTVGIRSGGPALQAGNLDDVRQQCHSSAMSQLSAAQQQEIQALGLCP
ncbi:hypothetical protein [Stenotrophomonas ginsengisoli]|uniref:hypothetical protein n=1 Tax=Stenotrophomonas ginsengisoli TaxID=336566 RepID=UPI000ACED121|nr:hypothetical protein [Stenotrophomonas ginsengisoli]